MTAPEPDPDDRSAAAPDPETSTATDPETSTATDPEDDATEGDSPNGEAARYRRRLRDTETERDTIAARLTGYQRREAERLAGSQLSRPDDLWLAGDDVSALLDDDGDVDPERVRVAVASVLDGRPQLRRGPRADPSQGARSSGGLTGGTGWQHVLRGER